MIFRDVFGYFIHINHGTIKGCFIFLFFEDRKSRAHSRIKNHQGYSARVSASKIAMSISIVVLGVYTFTFVVDAMLIDALKGKFTWGLKSQAPCPTHVNKS